MNVTLVDLPSYVPWIVFAPALAALIQNFWGKSLPRKGDFLVIGGMGVVIILRMGFVVVDVPVRIVVPFVKSAHVLKQLAHDIVARLAENPVAFAHKLTRITHLFQLLPGKG